MNHLRYPSQAEYHHDVHEVFSDAPQHQPNTGRRRQRPADLQRAEITPSRVNRIKDIFEEAASNLASIPPASECTLRHRDKFDTPVSNSTKQLVRLSVHKADSDYQIDSPSLSHQPSLPRLQSPNKPFLPGYRSTVASLSKLDKEPPSSGRKTPSRIPRLSRSPQKKIFNAGFTYGEDSDDEDVHSTHGVPLIMPIHHDEPNVLNVTTNVTRWLESVDAPSLQCPLAQLRKKTKTVSLKGKEKENIPPTDEGVAYPPLQASSASINTLGTKSSQPLVSISAQKGAKQAVIPDLQARSTPPTGLLLMPPRRMGMTPGLAVASQMSRELPASEPKLNKNRVRQVEICPVPGASDLDEEVVELSPSVTRYRKGSKGKRRGRYHTRAGSDAESAKDFARMMEKYEQEESEQCEERFRGRTTYRV